MDGTVAVVKELELLLHMAEYFDMRVEWVERLD